MSEYLKSAVAFVTADFSFILKMLLITELLQE